MIYFLAEMWVQYFGWFNLFTYVSSRAVFAALTAFVVGLLAAPAFIRRRQKKGHGQPVRDDGPKSHLEKSNTPTMGGVLIMAAMLLSLLLWGDWTNRYLWVMVFIVGIFALIGWSDDYRKIKTKSSKGISAAQKLALQSAATLAVLFYIWYADLIAGELAVTIPYWKDLFINLGVVGFFIIAYLAVVGASNAVNLTDGLDGLAILPAVMVAGGLGVYAYVTGHAVFSGYLGLPYIAGVHELAVFCAALIGAGLSFLWFNAHPAQIFMGDVGSLAIGAALGLTAVLVRQEAVFVIMSLVFVVEAMSVIMQVGSFKLTGRRIFKMAPLHHHFELKGWSETQIVIRFWIITVILVAIGLAGLKIR